MQSITKKTREVGTSAGVLLPRSWLNKQVVVTLYNPKIEDITQDALKILMERKLNQDVKGIYLYGSHARREQDDYSDIDILVITGKTNKLIKQDSYEILLIPESSFSKNLPDSLHYQSILKEALPILNKGLLDEYKAKKYKLNVQKIIKEISGIYRINKDSIETCRKNKKNVPDGIIYSLILRLRELYLVKCILSGKSYQKKDFLKLIGDPYSAYLRIKRDEKEIDNTRPEELSGLIELSEKWLKELKD